MNFIATVLLSASVSLLTVTNAFGLDRIQTKKWKEDINYFHQTLADRHIDLYHTISKEQFIEALDELSLRLPALDEHQVIFELMRITRLINDGHTQLPIMSGPHKHFPLRFRLFGKEVRVVAAAEAYKAYLGAKVVAVDGKCIDDVMDVLSPAVQGVENDFSLKSSLAFHLTIDDMLYAAGVTKNLGQAEFSIETDRSGVKALSLSSVPMAEFVGETKYRIEPQIQFDKRTAVYSDGFWLSTNKETKTAYLYFSKYPSFEDMIGFSESVKHHLEMENMENIIIDLRDNSGGDFFTGLALAHPILMTDSIDWQNGVYVLIGRKTFSAAMSNAVQFKQILNAKLVGEPTGGNPVGYQELGTFHLPNSNRAVFYSKRHYRFQETDTLGVQPDIFIETDTDAFKAGVDQALDWIIDDVKSRK